MPLRRSPGTRAASDVVAVARLPAEIGQPLPFAARLTTAAFHSWSTAHTHHTLRFVPAATSLGQSDPFFVGCHSRANFGYSAANEFVREAHLPAQNGQPRPIVRFEIVASHS
jgi:hypothetical protein